MMTTNEEENLKLVPTTVDGHTELVPTEQEIHNLSTQVTATSMLNNTLSTFVDDICEEVRQDDMYIKELQQIALEEARAGHLKPNELVALVTSATSNRNDLVSKIVSPSMQLLSAAQQNELNERREMAKEREAMVATPSHIRQVADIAPGDVLVGLQALFSQALAVKPAAVVEHQLSPEEQDTTPFKK